MRRIAIAVMGTISGLVMLFSYHTSTNSQVATTGTGSGTGTSDSAATGSSTDSSDSSGSDSSGSDSGSSSSGSSDSGSSSSPGTYTGDAVATQFGAVQVRITVEDGRITAAEAVQYPQHNHHDQEINSYAVPLLNEAAVQAQSADIDTVSGATVTSNGYVESLQSAIDKANL